MMFSVQVGLCALVLVSTFICTFSSEVNFDQNPGCEVRCDEPWLLNGTTSNGNSSKVTHYVWGAVEVPVFMIATAAQKLSMTVNWSKFQAGDPGQIIFEPIPNNVFGISFQRIILFDDPNDSGKLEDNDQRYAFQLSDFEWSYRMPITSQEAVTAYFETTSYKQTPLVNSSISINVTAFSGEGRDSELPHLNFGPQSVQVSVLLNNLVLDFNNISTINYDNLLVNEKKGKHHHHSHREISGFKSPRWALDMVVVSDDKLPQNTTTNFYYESSTSLDDEYAPGVFKLNNIMSESAHVTDSLNGGYMQYRPVCYLTPDKDVNFATTPNFNESLPPMDGDHYGMMHNSLLYATFGDGVTKLSGFQSTVAFGQPKDEFYTSFDYTIWTFTFGIGAPPVEHFSTVVIIAIAIGVGIPILMLLLGAVYMGVARIIRSRRPEELLINEDD